MPAGENVTTKFKVDISDLKSNITQANKLIKLANAEFKAASAGMDDWSKSATGIQAKLKQLASVLDAQKSKLSSYEQQLDRQKEAYDENGKRADQLKAKLQELANNGVKKTSDEYKKYQTELAAVEKEQTSNEKAIDNLKITILNQQAAVKSTEAEIRKYDTALENLGNEENNAAGETDKLNKKLEEADSAGGKASGGFTVMKGVLADLVAQGIRKAIDGLKDLADQAYKAWETYDEGADKIIAMTGATGKDAENLKKAYEGAAKNVVGDFSDIGEAIGEVNTRFGFTGDNLQSTAEQFLKFAKLNDTDVKSSIDDVQAAMATFNVSTSQAGNVLDLLNTAGQKTGTSVDKLSQLLTTNGTALKEMGFNITDATMFLANLNKSGVDASSVMSGLKRAVANAAKEGKPMSTAMQEIEKSIKNAKSPTEAAQKAIELFGTRSGAAIAQAVREGKISFQDLGGSLKDFTGNVSNTYEDTLDVNDKLELSFQNLKVEVAKTFDEFLKKNGPQLEKFIDNLTTKILPKLIPMLEGVFNGIENVTNVLDWFSENPGVVAIITGIATAIGALLTYVFLAVKLPAIISSVTTAVSTLFTVLSANPIGLVIAAVAALVAMFVYLWNNCEEFRQFWINLWDGIKRTASNVADWFSKKWTELRETLAKIPEWFSNAFGKAWTKITEKFKSWGAFWSNLWNIVKNKFSTIGSNVGEAISSTVKSGINRLIGWFERTINKIIEKINIAIDMINKVPGLNIRYVDYVNFRRMETGGVIKKPTTVLAGENGPEAIIPLKNNREWIRSVAAELGNILGFGSGGIVNNSVSNTATTNFTQNIYAPQAPSRLELYRQTKNLLSLAESVKGA